MPAILAVDSLFLPLGVVLFLLFCVVTVPKVLRRRRPKGGAEGEVDNEELRRLRADLRRAMDDGDPARIQALEDQIRIREYWVKKSQGVDLPDRMEKEPTSISDWNTSEKRFNNFR